MPNVTFIRHAETTYNANKIFAGQTDCELSSKGIIDTKNKFNYQPNDFDVYYCSPLKRTRQTLDLIVPGAKNVLCDNRIIEISLGDWEGKKKSEIPADILMAYRNGEYNPPNAETTAEVDQRVCNFVCDLFQHYDGQTKILVVAHNGVMRSIKRNFVANYENIMSNNLDSIKLNCENYLYYLQNHEKGMGQ